MNVLDVKPAGGRGFQVPAVKCKRALGCPVLLAHVLPLVYLSGGGSGA